MSVFFLVGDNFISQQDSSLIEYTESGLMWHAPRVESLNGLYLAQLHGNCYQIVWCVCGGMQQENTSNINLHIGAFDSCYYTVRQQTTVVKTFSTPRLRKINAWIMTKVYDGNLRQLMDLRCKIPIMNDLPYISSDHHLTMVHIQSDLLAHP